ncbi:sensor domain-containing diguanylate cyclase [Chitinolyticbacter meiyuanensis]|uniref:sensor domain-containing diguanylate cyclase n=1 Tax=Chitinolyticbacter meiyuanensis TaxID=682798 RepID=UPI0011E58A83|nr:diguanylate cyclase [Chitinolyticbacter meiyuanensis]
MPSSPTGPPLRWRLALALVVAYFASAACSLALGRALPDMPPLYWLPAGIATASFLIFGRVGGALVFGCSLLADGLLYGQGGPPGNWGIGQLPVALAATLQAGLAARAWRERERQHRRRFLQRSTELGYFWLRICLLPPLFCLPLLFAVLTMLRFVIPSLPATNLNQLPYLVLAHTLGTLLLAPCLVAWRDRAEWSWRWPPRRKWWSALAVPGVLLLALMLHGNALVLLLPVLLAVTVHYYWPGAMIAMLLVAVTLSAATLAGFGPFAAQVIAMRHVDLQLFLFSVGIMLQYLALGQEQLLRARRDLQRTVSERTRELQHANARLAEMATTDELTGLNNRREWQRRGAETMMLARRNGEPISLLMLDLDHFKSVNDNHGHLVGDLVLRAVSQACLATLRTTDNLGRWGGEEFVVMLPDTPLIEAARVAEKLRSNVAAAQVPDGDNDPITVTISIGVTTLRPADSDLDDLIKRADDALYAAKRAGRNRVVIDAEPLGTD